jgi:hypothetical protein
MGFGKVATGVSGADGIEAGVRAWTTSASTARRVERVELDVML